MTLSKTLHLFPIGIKYTPEIWVTIAFLILFKAQEKITRIFFSKTLEKQVLKFNIWHI